MVCIMGDYSQRDCLVKWSNNVLFFCCHCGGNNEQFLVQFSSGAVQLFSSYCTST
jgi:hypothetical protein